MSRHFWFQKVFGGYKQKLWDPSDAPQKGRSPVFSIKVSGFWRDSTETRMPNGKMCTCAQVRSAYEDSYPFSVTVEVDDIDHQGNESLRYNHPHGLPLKTLLGPFHEQEITVGTVFVTAAKPKSIVAPGSVSFPLYPRYHRGIRVIVDALSKTIYNEVHPFSN